jgi:signal transduction histidine kinase/CheY-like chemotaxis protein/HPt (histidine-containing phosphotransfer) domain-containing protein
MAEKKPKQKTYGIRTNVILGFTFAILAVAAAGYFTYESTSRLLSSVIELSRPDQKLAKLREVFSDLTAAENNMRIYALLKDDEYFENYLYHIFRADKNIDTLKAITDDNEEHHRKVRQISVLLNTRLRNIDEFMVFKRNTDTVNYAWRALQKLRVSPYDTTRTRIYTRTSTSRSLIDTLRMQPAINEKVEQSKGFFAKIAELFSGKEEPEENEEAAIEQVLQETTIIRDTSILVQTDTLLYHRLQKILVDLRDEEARMQQLLFEKEHELLQNNSLIINQIIDVISGLEQDEIMLANRQTAQAREVAGQSVMIISAVMLSSLFIILIFLFLILRAISRSNFLRNQLIIAKQNAEQLARVKEDFLATMSHEIRTPLNSILGFSRQLSKTTLNHEQVEQLDAVKLSSEHLLSLVNDILDFSKIEQGKLKLEKIPFTINDVVEETYKTFRVRAREKGVKLGYHIEFDGNLRLIGDPLRLKQVLFNLVGNAIKFTERGKVFMLCRKISDPLISADLIRLRFEVHDTGIGIAPGKLEAIFEGFTQADSSLSRRFGGTGLGLTISKHLIEMQNGIIGVESEAGKGSVFYFELPYTISGMALVDHPEAETRPGSLVLNGKYILLVDDDAFNVKLTRMILERWGVKVDSALSGSEALKKIGKNEYDLVLTDIHMPDMNGIELTRKIRAMIDVNKASLPIIAITANIMKDELDHYMKSGMDDYVLKPYPENELFAKIADQLGFDDHDFSVTSGEAPPSVALDKVDIDLKDIKRFSGGNKKAMAVILHSFINENKRNLESLEQSLINNDYPAISALAHKMLTSYGHLGVKEVADELRRLESIDGNPDRQQIQMLVKMVQSKSAGIFPFILMKAKEFEESVA